LVVQPQELSGAMADLITPLARDAEIVRGSPRMQMAFQETVQAQSWINVSNPVG
jgi:hypothetical protein